jgi:DNA-directed RNA polymerase specialized sigma24 family protein
MLRPTTQPVYGIASFNQRGSLMSTQRLSMRRIREVLRLRHVQGLTERVIARMIGVSNGVVHGYLRRARLAGLT